MRAELLGPLGVTGHGGGFVLDEEEMGTASVPDGRSVRYPFGSGGELLRATRETGRRISDLVMANELTWRSAEEMMQECVQSGRGPAGRPRRRRARRLPGQRGARRRGGRWDDGRQAVIRDAVDAAVRELAVFLVGAGPDQPIQR